MVRGQGELIDTLPMSAVDFDHAISVVIDFLAEQKGIVDTGKIGIFGTSLGAYFAMRAAAKDKRIAAYVSLSGNFDGRGLLNLAPMLRRDMLRKFGLDDDQPNLQPNRLIPPLSTLKQAIAAPLLLIHGGKDHTAVVGELERIRAWAQGQTEVWFYENAEHICYSLFAEILPAMGDWLAGQLQV